MQHLWPPPSLRALLVGLQVFQVAVLWLHDWLPLGRLNNPAAVKAENGGTALVRVTLLQSVPWSVGLIGSLFYANRVYPNWLWGWLWVSYLVLLAGELRAWWWPYLVLPDRRRADRYRRMFGNTHTFLPIRNGLAPNTLHVLLHAATLLTVTLLSLLQFGGFPG
jgi:hypothetical protein